MAVMIIYNNFKKVFTQARHKTASIEWQAYMPYKEQATVTAESLISCKHPNVCRVLPTVLCHKYATRSNIS